VQISHKANQVLQIHQLEFNPRKIAANIDAYINWSQTQGKIAANMVVANTSIGVQSKAKLLQIVFVANTSIEVKS
jgi:hypothetical protein